MRQTSTAPELAARVQNVEKSYGVGGARVRALDGVSVGIRRGRFTAIMGPSGSGKSTLMHIMAGLDVPTAGRAWIGDTEITGLADRELTVLRRRRVGFVFQSFNLVPTLDVHANILLPFDLDGRHPAADEASRIDRLIDTLGLADRLHHRPHELSGGQRQRVAIARALATAPDLVFADEPTGNLDSRAGQEVLDLLQSASRDHGQTIAMVTHDPVAAARADRVLFLDDGRVVADMPPQTAAEIAARMLAPHGVSADAAASGVSAGAVASGVPVRLSPFAPPLPAVGLAAAEPAGLAAAEAVGHSPAGPAGRMPVEAAE